MLVYQRVISLKSQFDWESDDEPVDWQYHSWTNQQRSKQRSTKMRVPPISLSYTNLEYNLFTQDFSWISSSPIFFISSTWKNNKKHMPTPSPHGSVLDLFKSSNHVATLRPVLHGGSAGSPLSSSSLRGRWPVGDAASGWRVFSPQELVV